MSKRLSAIQEIFNLAFTIRPLLEAHNNDITRTFALGHKHWNCAGPDLHFVLLTSSLRQQFDLFGTPVERIAGNEAMTHPAQWACRK